MPQLPGNALIDSAAFAAIVSYLLSLFKPFIESLPFATPGSRLHDTTIRLLNLVVNELLVLAAYAVSGPLSAQNIWLYAFQGLAQAIASDHLYSVLTGSSNGSTGASSNSPATGDANAQQPPVLASSNSATGQTALTTQVMQAASDALDAQRATQNT